MFNHRRKHGLHKRQRHDRAALAAARPRLRRFAVESLESRLLLSGNQVTGGNLDDSIYNLDSLGGNGFVVISQGDATTSPLTADAGTIGPSLGDVGGNNVGGIHVGGNQVPNVPLNTGQLQLLANPPILYLSDFQLNVAAPLTNNLGSTNSLIGAFTPPTLSPLPPAGLADDVIGTGDFNRDGFVDVADYRVWRDTPGPYNLQAYDNWKSNFGKSVVDLLDNGTLGGSLTVDFGGVSGPLPPITIDVTQSFEPVVVTRTLDAGFDLSLRIQDDIFAGGTKSIVKLDPVGPSDALSLSNDSVADEGLVIVASPVTVAKIEDADFATSGPTLIININGGSSQLIVATAPARIETSSPQQSQAEQELDQTIDVLLADDSILVSQTDGAGGETVASATTPESEVATDVNAADLFAGDSTNTQSQVGDSDAAPANQLAEGGMIAIGEIVDAATGDATATSISQLADAGETTELVGELSRVAVMELIQGEAEPGEPRSEDRVLIVAADDSPSLDAYRVVVQQAGVAIALASPAGPTYLASIATAAVEAASRAMATLVGNHLAADAVDGLASADAARQTAFSELGGAEDEVETTAALDGPHWNHWLAATPLVLAIACERALASRNKRRDPARPRSAK